MGVLFLAGYIYFIYLTAHFSFAIDYQQKTFTSVERAFQEREKAYFSAISTFRIEDELRARGFTKIASPHFLSRVISIALYEE